MRIGHGFDVHAFEKNKPLILGGIKIPYEFGMKAHSDGDVVIHALCDALLGAAALGDIGQHFPDTLDENKNRDSKEFLFYIMEKIKDKGFKLNNADITVIAEAPKLANHIIFMREILSQHCEVALDQINIKATTTEKLGYIGRKEGIAVHAVVLINTI